MDLDDARQQHAQWRDQLDSAARQTREPPDTATLADAGRCGFGAWLQGAGRQLHGDRPAWQHCLQRHADFHRAAGSVASSINRGDHAAARAMLAAGTPFVGAERALLAAIDALKAETEQAQRPPAAAPATPAEPQPTLVAAVRQRTPV
ncbi:MAG: CZB domain-containing protein [Burkholderiaceae bacterium]|nr:CZB domain-containing protein [Burkholderiaceae bacterium]